MIKGKNLISILDVGSSKITCFIAKKNFSKGYEIIGTAQVCSKGVRSGMIIDIEAAKQSIISAVETAEDIASEPVKNLYISLNSCFLLSGRDYASLMLSNHEITIKDLNKILFQILERYNRLEVEIIHTFPYEYILDGNRRIKNPLGLYGHKLTGFFHVICVPINYITNIRKCLEKCQLKVEGYVSGSYAAGLACLTREELEFGCVLIEISGESSTVSVFFNDNMIFTDGVPYGGMQVTKDIAKVLNLDIDTAEKIKNKHGSVVEDNSTVQQKIKVEIDLSQQEDDYFIDHSKLNEIIRARVHEIIMLLKGKLQNKNMIEVTNKVVITGGCVELLGIKELVEQLFKMKSRIAMPINQEDIGQEYMRPGFSVAFGMLKYANDIKCYDKQNLLEDKSSFIKKAFCWLKENF